ncbi:RES domain-containing protein [Salinisphaera sp. SPP-AMP-43]|uniref:RES family NAD+ phosphorylase n=1 Tax=Salinisphaera sp. SPP-AMP-43 TaxID=3121288 RepID=UPI003C6DDB07
MTWPLERFIGHVYRAHNPRWAFAPDSGAGAAKHGGRFNPPGTAALYTSSTYTLAIAEAQQGFPYKFQPLTLVSYDIDHAGVLDLSTPAAREAAGIPLAELDCAWELLAFDKQTPPSWALAARLIEQGVGAIAVPSFCDGAHELGINYVFWHWNQGDNPQVRVIDDDNRLRSR